MNSLRRQITPFGAIATIGLKRLKWAGADSPLLEIKWRSDLHRNRSQQEMENDKTILMT